MKNKTTVSRPDNGHRGGPRINKKNTSSKKTKSNEETTQTQWAPFQSRDFHPMERGGNSPFQSRLPSGDFTISSATATTLERTYAGTSLRFSALPPTPLTAPSLVIHTNPQASPFLQPMNQHLRTAPNPFCLPPPQTNNNHRNKDSSNLRKGHGVRNKQPPKK